MTSSYIDAFRISPEKTVLQSFYGTFINPDAISNIRTDQILDAIATAHNRDVTFKHGININFIRELKNFTMRSPKLIGANGSLTMSSNFKLPVVNSGAYPIPTGILFTVIPPLTEGSGSVIYSLNEGASIYVPEVMDYNFFHKEFNQLLSTCFRITNALSNVPGEDKQILRNNITMAHLKEDLSSNSIWARLVRSMQMNLTGTYDDTDERTYLEIYNLIEEFWLPIITDSIAFSRAENQEVMIGLQRAVQEFNDIKFENMNNATTLAEINQAAVKTRDLHERMEKLSRQVERYEPNLIGKVEEAESHLVYPGQEMIVMLAGPLTGI